MIPKSGDRFSEQIMRQEKSAAMSAPSILVFDSGLGGLTVFREVAAARPDANYVYLADDAAFPYGDLAEQALVDRVVHVIGNAIGQYKPDLVVIACNTASTLALAELRSALHRALRRHRAGDQAGLRAVGKQAHRRARHAGDRQP